MRCPHCGQEHPDSIAYCPTTGRKLVAMQFCSNCGAEIQESWKICPKCGTPVSESSRLPLGRKRQTAGPNQSKTPGRLWIPVLFSILVLALVTYLIFPSLGVSVDKPSVQATREITASEGGQLTLSDKTILKIPPGSLKQDTQVSIQKPALESAPALQPELISVGSAYAVDLGSEPLQQPVTLEIPFDRVLLPNDVTSSQVFLSYYDEDKKEWVYAGGKVDISRNVIVLETTHASWWMPTTWNWGAWIAVLNKTLQVSIVNWVEAAKLLTDDCPQTGSYVQVDSSQARNLVQGCIEQDDAERLGLRIVNPKSFFFEIRPISGGNGYPQQTLLSPGESLQFDASTSDPAPLVIEANMTQKSGWYLVVHMVLTMLPGANQFGIQGKQVACITERLADADYFFDVVEALLVDQNGAAAAESLSEFMLDGDAVRRFITAADDCNFGPAPTWSVEGIRQIGGSVSTIISATDYVANYFAGNTSAQVSFIWESQSISTILDGFWEGPVNQPGAPYYTTNLTLTGCSEPNKVCGSVDYPELSCGGTITFLGMENGKYRLRENMTYGKEACVDEAEIELSYITGNSWNAIYSWSGVEGSGTAEALLEKKSQSAPRPERTQESIGKIVFSCGYNGTWQLCSMNADGSNQSRLTNITTGALSPTWSPDGLKIAFLTYVDGRYDIYVMNADGSQLREIVRDGSDFDWSPDSNKIVFNSKRDGRFEIYVIDVNTGNLTKLTDDPTDALLPIWSPDGMLIAFMTDRDGSREIYTMAADGSNQSRLTTNSAEDWIQGWSPDSTKLVFVSDRDGNREIYVMDWDGKNQTRLTFDFGEDKWATWSPDGSRIFFTRALANDRFEGYIMNADGSDQIQITTDPLAVWSPDGLKIAYWSSQEGSEQIYIIDYDGGNQIRLTQNPSGNRWPSWHR